jgi:hypothetical protein
MNGLPWIEKYRPKSMADVAAQQETVAVLRKSIESSNVRSDPAHFFAEMSLYTEISVDFSSRICCSMDRLEQGRPLRSWLSLENFMGKYMCIGFSLQSFERI